MMKGLLRIAAFLLALAPFSAAAQSGCQYIAPGAVLTAGQWNQCFAQKSDTVTGGYLPLQGGTMLGRLIASAATATAGFNIPQGSTPTAPQNGDIWITSSGFFAQINGATVGPFANGSTFLPLAGGTMTGTITGSDAGTWGTGGINGSVIGATTPEAGHFTTGSLSGALTYGGVTLSAAVTGTGSMVLSTSPTLTTPNLGTPSAATLTNATGLPFTTGVTGGSSTGVGIFTTGTPSIAATLSVPLGGSGLASFTANTIYMGAGTSALTPSSLTDNGTSVTTAENITTTGSLNVGANTSFHQVEINGAGSGTGNFGAQITLLNNSSPIGAIGNYSAIFGGAYNNTLTIYAPTNLAIMSGNVGVGTTSPAFDGNGQVYFAINNGTSNAYSELGLGGNVSGTANSVGGLNFYNSSLGTTDKRIAAIFALTQGATNSGELYFLTYNAGTQDLWMTIGSTGLITTLGALDIASGLELNGSNGTLGQCLLASGSISSPPTWGACVSGSGSITSITSTGGTLTPTGSSTVNIDLNLSHSNTWVAAQVFGSLAATSFRNVYDLGNIVTCSGSTNATTAFNNAITAGYLLIHLPTGCFVKGNNGPNGAGAYTEVPPSVTVIGDGVGSVLAAVDRTSASSPGVIYLDGLANVQNVGLQSYTGDFSGFISNNPMPTAVSGAINNGSGLCRLTVGSTTGMATGEKATITGVSGATGCNTASNSSTTITVINGTTLDEQGTTFGGTYTSGGQVGMQKTVITPFSNNVGSTQEPANSAVGTGAYVISAITTPEGLSSSDNAALALDQNTTGDAIFVSTTGATGGVGMRVWPQGSGDTGILVQDGIANAGNVHDGIHLIEYGTNLGSGGVVLERANNSTTPLMVMEDDGLSSSTATWENFGINHQSGGVIVAFFQGTTSFSGDFINVNADISGAGFTGNYLNFLDNGQTVYKVSSGGKVTIGTGASVSSASNFQLASSQSSGALVAMTNSHATAGDALENMGVGFNGNDTTSTYIAFFDAGGNTFQGSIHRNGNGAVQYTASSDERTKIDVHPTHYGLDDLMKIDVVDYHKIGDGHSGPLHTGILAQQVEPIYPEAIAVGGDDWRTDPWSADYGLFSPLIMASVQDVQHEITSVMDDQEKMRREIAALRRQVEKLKEEVR